MIFTAMKWKGKHQKFYFSTYISLVPTDSAVCLQFFRLYRSVHDSLCVVKRVMESKNVVVGGGAVEAALSIYLENFATTLSSRLEKKITYLLFFHEKY